MVLKPLIFALKGIHQVKDIACFFTFFTTLDVIYSDVRIQAIWEPSILVWAPKKGFLTFYLKIFFKHPQKRVFRYSIYVI